LQDPPKIHGASIAALLDLLKRPEYRYRYWAKRELRDRDHGTVKRELDRWTAQLDRNDPRREHHLLEAVWLYRGIDEASTDILSELLGSENHLARAAATRQLRYGTSEVDTQTQHLRERAQDESELVRLEAVIAASYIGTPKALQIAVDVAKQPAGTHLKYAVATSLGSENLSRHWKGAEQEYPAVGEFLGSFERDSKLLEGSTTRDSTESAFDSQKGITIVDISCLPERMMFTVTAFTVKAGKPVKLTLENPTATPHNLVIVEPGAAEEVGMAGNQMATDPNGASKHFVPDSPKVLFATKLLDPDTSETLRFIAPKETGEYPYICTFPGHWVIMRGVMTVEK